MDCCAVALAAGSAKLKDRTGHRIILTGFPFPHGGRRRGPGFYLVAFIAGFDHWVAFAILVAIGVMMIFEPLFEMDKPGRDCYARRTVLVLLSSAASIYAPGVGLVTGFPDSGILPTALAIGLASRVFPLIGIEPG